MEHSQATSNVDEPIDPLLENVLDLKYPGQGLQGKLQPQSEKALLMWATIYDHARIGNIHLIRPDILVQHFTSIAHIADRGQPSRSSELEDVDSSDGKSHPVPSTPT